jgi:2-haloacid dehalogenase
VNAALDITQFSVLTFDCYGTLIDWESGLLDAFGRLLPRFGVAVDDSLLALFAALESRLEAGPYLRYRSVLRSVLLEMGRTLGFSPASGDADEFADSVGSWPPFADSSAALKALGTRYRIGVISNVDDDLFARSARQLDVQFDWVVTAEQVGAYKPARAMFDVAIGRIGAPTDRILHVAQSLYHDIGPAKALGLSTVWVNRRSERPGWGATPPAVAEPDVRVADLTALARLAAVL